MSKDLTPEENEIILYTNPQCDIKLAVLVLDETVWLTQGGIQELYGRTKSTINEHISNAFSDGELIKDSVVRKFRTIASDAKEDDKFNKTQKIESDFISK